jgi:hypothetical protein
MRIVGLLISVCFGIVVAACSNPFATAAGAAIDVQLAEGGLAIRNQSAKPVFYTVMDASFAARANWAPCVRPGCPSVAPGVGSTVDSAMVGGWRESDQLIVFWWLSVPAAAVGAFEPGAVHAIKVRY